MKTHYFHNLEFFFGGKLTQKIPDLKKRQHEYSLIDSLYFRHSFVSNPILKAFTIAAGVQQGKIVFDMARLSGSGVEFVYLKTLGNLIKYVEKELNANQDYKKEIISRLLNDGSGPFYTAFCELLVGGFLKFCGCEISYSSSQQTGQPDVMVSKPIEFANDSKLFNDSEFWLKDGILEAKDELVKFLSSLNDVKIVMMVTDMKKFRKQLPVAMANFLTSPKIQKSDSLWILNAPNYDGDQGYVVDYIPSKSSIRIIPSIAMTSEAVQEKVDKAKQQFSNAGLMGIVWMFFPHPKGAAIERQIIGQVSGIPDSYKADGLGMVLCDFEAVLGVDDYRGGIKYALDFFTNNKNFQFINKDNFSKFISDVLDGPTLFVS